MTVETKGRTTLGIHYDIRQKINIFNCFQIFFGETTYPGAYHSGIFFVKRNKIEALAVAQSWTISHEKN